MNYIPINLAMVQLEQKRLIKLTMLAVMLHKLSKLYPEFSYEISWEEAHVLLADFCVPEEYRNDISEEYTDTYYHALIAQSLKISQCDVQLGFECASKLEESQS